MENFEILKIAANALNNKKAIDLHAVKVTDLTVLTDYFLIATATSNTHVHALADEVEEKLAELGVKANHIEGKSTDWILLDYGTVIVHIFQQENREYYNLERLWADASIVDLSDIITEN